MAAVGNPPAIYTPPTPSSLQPYIPSTTQPTYQPRQPAPLPTDAEDSGTSGNNCTMLNYNMKYRSRDAQTNGEVSDLQDFLQSRGYLNSEPTGYFGLATVAAVKQFQLGAGISPTGTIGGVSRAKIRQLSCGVATATPSTSSQQASLLEQLQTLLVEIKARVGGN